MTYPTPTYSDRQKIKRSIRRMTPKDEKLYDLYYEGYLVQGCTGVNSGIAYSLARMMFRNGCGDRFEISEHGQNCKRKINFKTKKT